MTNTNTVKCKNCKHHTAQLSDCSIWLKKVYEPDSTVMETGKLCKELNGDQFCFDEVDAERNCKHFEANNG